MSMTILHSRPLEHEHDHGWPFLCTLDIRSDRCEVLCIILVVGTLWTTCYSFEQMSPTYLTPFDSNTTRTHSGFE